MRAQVRRVLVAIRDLHHPPRNELRKAAELARAAKASIELFHAVDAPEHAELKMRTAERRLAQFSRLALLRSLDVSCHCNSDYPPHEAIIRRARQMRADLVVVATRARGLAKRLFLRNTDWELIRQCPCPVLLVKSPRPYARSVIIAAVDPFHAHAKPADLDTELLAWGNSFARLFKSSLHVFHAFAPLVSTVPGPLVSAVPVTPPPEVEEAHAELITRELARLAKSVGVPPRAQHLSMGVVGSELCAVTRKTRASMAVMGAVSRSALRRIFIGSTAESTLDKLECDVLVVKPRGFKSTIPARPFVMGRIRSEPRSTH